MDSLFLLIAAVLPVFLLLCFIYSKDSHKEPMNLLIKLFVLGIVIIAPVIVCELVLQGFFPTGQGLNLITLFVNVFISIALAEEGFKWIVVKLVGYNGKEFDEIYDIIVYSVFVSLGFACLENIGYVFQYGMVNAIVRAITSIPGHACFAVSMGVYLAKAKIASLNGRNSLYTRNLFLSILVPTLLHTFYDTFAFAGVTLLFYGFHFCMVGFCFYNVNKVAKMQVSFNGNIRKGTITNNNGMISYNSSVSNSSSNSSSSSNSNNSSSASAPRSDVNAGVLNFCPICGSKYKGGSFCGSCGFKLK